MCLGAPIQVQSLAIGDDHACRVDVDGALYCTGSNAKGQLGIGAADDTVHLDWQRVGNDADWVEVVAGWAASCARKSGGTVYCWGSGDNGQLGLGDTKDRAAPTQVGSDANWVRLSMKRLHVCALRDSGALWCWGYNTSGALAQPTSQLGQSNLPIQLGTDTDWKGVAAGANYTHAWKSDGTLFATGGAYSGALGLGDGTDRDTLTQVTGGPWSLVASGWGASLAVDDKNELFYWGGGMSAIAAKNAPTLLDGASGWKLVSVGSHHACAIDNAGRLECVGAGARGQLGNGKTQDQAALTGVAGSGWSGVAAGADATCAWSADGSLSCWGTGKNVGLGSGDVLQPTAECLPTR